MIKAVTMGIAAFMLVGWGAETRAEVNIAVNLARTGQPDPLESDRGWGGGSYPWDMLDDKTAYTDTWAHGLAFTGGIQSWMGEACGWRQATVRFDGPKTFDRVLVWHHGDEHIPNTYLVEYWDGQSWLPVGGSSELRRDLAAGQEGWGSVPTETVFPAVTGSKVRFRLNNCDITHGWIYEFQVFASEAPTPMSVHASVNAGAEIYPGDSVPVQIDVRNARDLFALQLACGVDPGVLTPGEAAFGGLFDPVHRLVAANRFDATGGWLGAISQVRPAVPLSGNGNVATVSYTAQAPGRSTFSCEPLASDRRGAVLPVAFADAPTLQVQPFASIHGTARYDGRSSHADIQVTATGRTTVTVPTGASGDYVFDALRGDTYVIRAVAASYLSACTTVTVLAGATAAADPLLLLGGDLNGDGVIDIGDAALLGGNFETMPIGDPRADINGDGRVNVQDLALLAGNYGLSGCQASVAG